MAWIKNILICFLISCYYYSLLSLLFNSSSNSWIKDDKDQLNHYITAETFTQSSEEEDMEEIYDEPLYLISFFLYGIDDSLILNIISILLFIIPYF